MNWDGPVYWRDCSEARYHEMLGALPPAWYERGGFLVGEPMDHDHTGTPRYTAFRHDRYGYRESDRPMTIEEFRNG